MEFHLRNGGPCTIVLATILLIGGQASADEPSYETFHEAAYLRFFNSNEWPLRRAPSLGITFGERVHRATLDTGSTGVVVGATSMPNSDQLPKIGDGQLTYTSSGRIMRGRWVRTSFTILGGDGTAVQTEAMPVLAVDRVDCLAQARDCNPGEDVSRIAMIGIGFAREGDRQSESTPDKNPFLHIVSNSAARRRGYVLTSEGVHIGLSSSNTAGVFSYIKLQRKADGTDWSPVPACISINGTTPPSCGSLLVDSGVGAAFITVPPAQTTATELQQGDQIAVTVPQKQTAFPLYSFRLGDGSPLTPDKIFLHHARDRTFLNTSYRFLNGFDFLYDADGGYAGFRRREARQ